MPPPTAHLQSQSALVQLPGEIRNLIYRFCFTADETITDPIVTHCVNNSLLKNSPYHAIPPLGVTLIATCRRIAHEADIRALYASNTFRFTSVTHASHFFSALPQACSELVRDVELDIRAISSEHPSLSREWTQYLSWSQGIWAKKLGSLRLDAPGLQVLRLNFESWPRVGGITRKHLWDTLRRMVINVEGMQRVVVTGASKGPAMEKTVPWSPVHFVGTDDVFQDDLLDKMWGAVGEASAHDDHSLDKLIRWKRDGGILTLEVVTAEYVLKNDPAWSYQRHPRELSEELPANGYCTRYEYRQRKLLQPRAPGY